MDQVDLRLRHDDINRGREIRIYFDGEPITAYEGETVAAALMAAGKRCFRITKVDGKPRGVYCGMGVCYDCLAVIGGGASRRTCMVYVREDMRVETQHAWGTAE